VNQLVPFRQSTLPELVAVAGERAGIRFLEFFAANIRNPARTNERPIFSA